MTWLELNILLSHYSLLITNLFSYFPDYHIYLTRYASHYISLQHFSAYSNTEDEIPQPCWTPTLPENLCDKTQEPAHSSIRPHTFPLSTPETPPGGPLAHEHIKIPI